MVSIKQATKKDVEKLYNLIIAIAKHHNQEYAVTTNTQELLNSGFSKNPKFGALLAEVDNTIVGYLSYTWNYSIWSGSEYMNLDDLFVLEAYRNHKIGLQLMQQAKATCKQKNIHIIRWEVQKDNHKAIKFYTNLGAIMKEKGIFRWDLTSN